MGRPLSEASVRNRGAQSGPAEPIHVPWTGPALDESAEAEGSLQDHGATVIAPGAAIVHAPAKPARQGAGALRALRSRTPRPPRVRVRVHTLDSLRYREFRLLWVSTLGIGGGFWVQQLIVGWLTYSLTRSPLLTSLALGLEALPFLLGGPIGGILADQWDRRRLLMAVSAYQAAVTAGFSVVVLLDRVETWHIFAFVLAMGSSWAVSSPARLRHSP